MATLKYWAWLSAKADMRPKTRYRLVEAFGDPEKVYFADEKQLMEKCELTDAERAHISDKSLDRAEEILEICTNCGYGILTIGDAAYPKRLANIYDPPIVLYTRGRLPAVDEQACIALVGTRDASPYGIKIGRGLGYEITRGGGLVVTGLAAGVDSASAEGALRAGGSCIGVLGCAIDDVYPRNNNILYDDVALVGALVSEYPPGTPGRGSFFPERNRIISGLSVGVAVIEAPEGSGALITASRALDQGREVFAVPGNVDAPKCRGSNQLIREGAMLATCGWDILSEFEKQFPDKLQKPDLRRKPDLDSMPARPEPRREKREKPETGEDFAKLREPTVRKKVDKPEKREYIDLKEQLKGLNDSQLKIVGAMDENAKHVDDIIDSTGLPASTVLSELTVLQIKGFVIQQPGKRFSLNIIKL